MRRASAGSWRMGSRIRDELLWWLTTEGPASITLDFPRKTAATVNREFLDWLDHKEGKPFFAFLNYFDAHDPYLPPRAADPSHGSRPEVAFENSRCSETGRN